MPDALTRLLPGTPASVRVIDRGIVVAVGGREFSSQPPVVSTMPTGLLHLGPWRVAPGGSLAEDAATEAGLSAGYAESDLHDDGWAGCSRINEISIGAPSWESDSFRGWIWYRGEFVVPADWVGDGRLVLGSPTECRRLGWNVYLDGQELTDGVLDAPVLELVIQAALLTPGEHRLAVRQRVAGDVPIERRQELEGWRRIDVFCQQTLTPVAACSPGVALDRVTTAGDLVIFEDSAGEWRIESRWTVCSEGVLARSTLRRLGGVTILSDVTMAEIDDTATIVHPEGFWAALSEGAVVAGADPAAVTVRTGTGAAVRTWPGLRLDADQDVELPAVFLAVDPGGDPRAPIGRLLGQLGRRRADMAIYDPYGWYQISHASEPKIEISDELMGPIGEVLAKARELGLRFDFLSLDCGWNDPDDLSRFHPVSFPNGPQSVLDAVRANDSALMLWVSPSDGPRAFRHELGLVNPGFDGGTSQNPGLPWRLCPSYAPWRDAFRNSLLHLVGTYGVQGFKLDGTELYCRADDHDHLPGLWSIWANVRSLQATLEAVADAGATYLMLYWGLRSPWWLRWASTVWERGYLVEAAAPSGRAGWTIRGSVMSSQDIGTTDDWWSLPPHQQDSLGVWVSDTRWASHQGLAGWDDAVVMDAARGSRALQLWGDLRPLVGLESNRLRELIELLDARRTELSGSGRPIGAAASGTAAYGYAWRAAETSWIVLSQPGDGSETVLSWTDLGGRPGESAAAEIDYLTRGAAAAVEVGPDGLRIRQSGGSVVGIHCGSGLTGSARLGDPDPLGAIVVSEPRRSDGPAPDELMAPALIGRVPHLANWMAGDVAAVGFDPAMLIGTPAEDRALGRRDESWTVDLAAGRDAELAVVVRFARDGVAWHHDLLHEIASLTVDVDGDPVDGASYPNFRHEQAGSWSWLRLTTRVPAGRHRLAVRLEAICPPDLTTTLDVWLRQPATAAAETPIYRAEGGTAIGAGRLAADAAVT